MALTVAMRQALLAFSGGSMSIVLAGTTVGTAYALIRRGHLAQQGASLTKDCVCYITEAGRRALDPAKGGDE